MFLQTEDFLPQVANFNVHPEVGGQTLSGRHKLASLPQIKLLQMKALPHIPRAGGEQGDRDGVGVAGPDEGGGGDLEEVEVLLQLRQAGGAQQSVPPRGDERVAELLQQPLHVLAVRHHLLQDPEAESGHQAAAAAQPDLLSEPAEEELLQSGRPVLLCQILEGTWNRRSKSFRF